MTVTDAKDLEAKLRAHFVVLDPEARAHAIAEQLAKADVLVMYAQDSGNITPEQRPVLEAFIKRGGGIVVIHTASVANKPDTSPYWKSIIGGSWVAPKDAIAAGNWSRITQLAGEAAALR